MQVLPKDPTIRLQGLKSMMLDLIEPHDDSTSKQQLFYDPILYEKT